MSISNDGGLLSDASNGAGKGELVVVTGGTGFIGSYIIRNLVERGLRVRAIRRSARVPCYIPESILAQVEWVEGDVLDVVSLEDAFRGAAMAVHAAAVVSFASQDRRRMYKVNVEGTENVVNAALAENVRRFLHISSVAALGRTKKMEFVNEEKAWEEGTNNTHYAISKHHGEMHVWRAIAEGLPAVIINPSTVLGYGDWNQSSCALFKNVYNGFPWYTTGVNGFVGVDDVAEVSARLLLSDIEQERFIVNADNWSFQKVFSTIAAGFEKKPPHREATRAMGALAWRLESLKSAFTGKRPLLTRETAKVAQSLTHFDNTAVLKALPGFAFTPLEVVIKEACRKYRKAVEGLRG